MLKINFDYCHINAEYSYYLNFEIQKNKRKCTPNK